MEKHVAPIRKLVRSNTSVSRHSIHGPSHWARVEANGLRIAKEIGSDPLVVTLFALLHESQRLNDGHDPEHGARAAAFARSVRSELSFLSEDQMDQLCHACHWHTDEIHHHDLTIGTCYDADRLDLGRVGIEPDPKYLNSDYSKRLAMTRRDREWQHGRRQRRKSR